ncbi:MAG: thioesterase family protein [Deltaproteobacteria bacterium]|jgi:acyl-CoA thioester hydrolase
MRPTRDSYRWFTTVATRWADNDVYGHVNNVVYYAFFDTAVNRYLIEEGVLDIHEGDSIGLVVETSCRYHEPVAFPESVDVGVRVTRIGNSSVHYEVGVFRAGADTAAADGRFIHVYVDRVTRRPKPLGASMRECLERVLVLDPAR